jgi:hypothetical protein
MDEQYYEDPETVTNGDAVRGRRINDIFSIN